MSFKILLVDDDKYFRIAVKEIASQFGITAEYSDSKSAIEAIQNEFFDFAIIDMQMENDSSGLQVLEQCKSKNIYSIILSSSKDEEILKKSYQLGCEHFLTKLNYKDFLSSYLEKFSKAKIQNKIEYKTTDKFLKQRLEDICSLHLKDQSILITGETGVGKTQVAKYIHHSFQNDDKNFIHINCSEIPENLIESELFGHKKGSFTGANNDKKGKLELANNGTLFLDEIGTMSVTMQQKLLKALDEKTFYSVGSSSPTKSRFTLITATCDDLFEKISNQDFRKDFFYRISGINLHIPSLRERKKDINLLLKFFLEKSPRRVCLDKKAVQLLEDYKWPGNIRELKKICSLLMQQKGGIISPENVKDYLDINELQQKQDFIDQKYINFISQNGLKSFIAMIEEKAVSHSLDKHQGKITHAIKELGISTSAFYRIFEKLKT